MATDKKWNGKDPFEVELETSNRISDKIAELLKNSDVVWEGLGPDAIGDIAKASGFNYVELEKEFRHRIVKAYLEDDLHTIGQMFYYLLTSYVQAIALKEEASSKTYFSMLDDV